MRLTIAAVGRLKSGPERDLVERYAKLIRWKLSVREVEERTPLPPPQLKAREGEKLLGACPQGATVVALDARGKAQTSEQFAARFRDWEESGIPDVAFLIGGAEGLDDATRSKTDLLVSFGAATWPHMMVRPMLVEQIYRAQQILAGHPYHRG